MALCTMAVIWREGNESIFFLPGVYLASRKKKNPSYKLRISFYYFFST